MDTENTGTDKTCNTPIKYLMRPPSHNITTASGSDSPFKFAAHSTPPSKFFRVRNPFDAALANRLHLPAVSSPSVFKKLPTPAKEFQWTIDQLSSLKPVHIEEHCSNQFDQPEDPELERTAQINIDKYFRESKQIVPSPWDEIPRKQIILPKGDHSTPLRSTALKNDVEKRDNACQTVLSLPPVLPPEVEQILQPFFTFTEDQQQQCSKNSENLMNVSLCRRLFHFSEDGESSIDTNSPNSSMKSGDLPPFLSPKLNESGKHSDKSFEHRKFMMQSPELSPVRSITSNSDELLDMHSKDQHKMSLIHQSTPTPSPQSFKNLICEKETLEESPLSPITKVTSSDNSSNKIQSSSPIIQVHETQAATNNIANINVSRRSIKRLDFSDEMCIDYVPDAENLPDQSINMMGTSILVNEDEVDCTYSSVNWDIENKSISNTRPPANHQIENDNVLKTISKHRFETPSKSLRFRTLLKKYSDNFDEREKENIAPGHKKLLFRRCFSSDMACDCDNGNKSRCRFHHFNKYRVNSSYASENTEDSDIRDRSLLENDRNPSPNSYFLSTETTQDTGYNSHVGGESGRSSTIAATSLTNIFSNKILIDGGNSTMTSTTESSMRID